MRIATARHRDRTISGIVVGETLHPLPDGMTALDLVRLGLRAALELADAAIAGSPGVPLAEVRLLPPIEPPAMRDFVSFEEHVEGVVRSVSGEGGVQPEWYQAPTFYFTNPHTLRATGDEIAAPSGSVALDFELELAAVVGRVDGSDGRDLTPAQAHEAIFGYTILNDWSARDLQRREMKVNLGPCKGKDFANTLGPWIVTADEFEHLHDDEGFLPISLSVSINGEPFGQDLLSNMGWPFAELVAYASRDSRVAPGDVLGSGTTGSGCLAEAWGRAGTGRAGSQTPPPLVPGDVVRMDVEGVGWIENRIVAREPLPPVAPRAQPAAEPGRRVTAEAFLAAAERILGRDGVIRPTDAGIRDYADPYSFTSESTGSTASAAGAVMPGTAAEVQALLRAANEHSTTLWTVSRGRNLGYGAAAPRDPSSVVLDLHRMDRIVRVDADAAFAVVEPGVSFFALDEHLREHDIPLMLSVPDLGGGSIIGNALERGFGYTSYGRHAENLCGLEVVLPTGEMVRTGMAAADDSAQAHLYSGGFGPRLDGLFQQSNLGVVTRAGVWLRPPPAEIAACSISVRNPDQLAALVDTVRVLQLDGVIDGVAIVGNALAIASGIMPRSALYAGPAPIPLEVIHRFTDSIGVGFWNARFGLYGDPAIIDAKLAVITAALDAGARLDARRYPGDVDPAAVHPADRAQLGIPSSELSQMAAWRGGTPAHTDFSVVCGTRGFEAAELVDLVRGVIEAEGLDHAGGFTMFGRHAVMLSLVSFDASDADDRARVDRLFGTLISAAAERGFLPYRSHIAFMDRISELYDADDHASRRFVQTIKSAIDPAGVLSPGKQGVWPLASVLA